MKNEMTERFNDTATDGFDSLSVDINLRRAFSGKDPEPLPQHFAVLVARLRQIEKGPAYECHT